MKRLIVALLMISSTAMAGKYDLIYLRNGKQVTPEQGILAAASGETIYKCQTVEAKVSKSGTSVSLRAIKKPKTQEQVDEQIKELQKQVEPK